MCLSGSFAGSGFLTGDLSCYGCVACALIYLDATTFEPHTIVATTWISAELLAEDAQCDNMPDMLSL
jgi:hypothetical protein